MTRCCFIFVFIAGWWGATQTSIASSLREFLADHCVDCHAGGTDADGGLDLEAVAYRLVDERDFERWRRILSRVESGEMPPESADPPDPTDRKRFSAELRGQLVKHQSDRHNKLGRSASRRLNRFEYERTVQDLLGVSIPLAEHLPAETSGSEFDTVGDGLRFSPLHIERYLKAADIALTDALNLGENPLQASGKTRVQHFDYRAQKGILNNLKSDRPIVRLVDDGAVIFSDASYINLVKGLKLAQAGMYRVRVRARGFQTDRKVTMSLHVGNWNKGTKRMVEFFDVHPTDSREFETTLRLETNDHLYPAPKRLRIDPEGHGVWHYGGDQYKGEGILIHWIEVEGPLETQWPPRRLQTLIGNARTEKMEHGRWEHDHQVAYRIVSDDPVADLRDAVTQFAQRAFREPVDADVIQPFIAVGVDAVNRGVFRHLKGHPGDRSQPKLVRASKLP
ncbi:MAG: DUF1587 domain-containing protein, partial [Planctomycetota bacterium]